MEIKAACPVALVYSMLCDMLEPRKMTQENHQTRSDDHKLWYDSKENVLFTVKKFCTDTLAKLLNQAFEGTRGTIWVWELVWQECFSLRGKIICARAHRQSQTVPEEGVRIENK